MKYIDKKNIIRKLLRSELTLSERLALTESQEVSGYMKNIWDQVPDSVSSDCPDSHRIWLNICREAFGSDYKRKFQRYKIYSAVASLLLLLGIGATAYRATIEEAPAIVYIVSSGIQNMESLSLPDGTLVQMGPGSRLTYPAAFSATSREVSLDGQAFFDVAKDPRKPFIVHASNMDVQALGTAFEVFDYEMENRSEAILLRGKVKVSMPSAGNGKEREVILSPNERLMFDKKEGLLYKSTLDADKYTSWRKQKILSFENEKLSMIIPRLEKWYGRKVICQEDQAEKYRFTFKIKDESLDLILTMISKSSPLKFRKTNGGDYILNIK